MYRDVLTLKNIVLNFICAYAIIYPIFADLLMNHEDGAVGTFDVQIIQILTVFSLIYLWRFRRKVNSLKEYINVWSLGIAYFTSLAIYFALFVSVNESLAEIVFAARFLSWFVFAITFAQVDLSTKFYNRLAKSFWLGGVLQTLICVWYLIFGRGESIYDEVFATTGSSQVSGKMVAAFVVLEIVLSIYWFLTEKKIRFIYIITTFLGLIVVLFSYNRATQLGLITAYFSVFFWMIRRMHFRVASAMMFFFIVGAIFFVSSYGNTFASRWENVLIDQGNGRTRIIEAVMQNLWTPESVGKFWFGYGCEGVKIVMYEALGNRIGTHNDFLDMLTIYGFIGGIFYICIVIKFWNFSKKADSSTIEATILRASTIFVLLTGLCTGLFQATYLFFMYITLQYYFLNKSKEKMLSWQRRQRINEPNNVVCEREYQEDEFSDDEFDVEQDNDDAQIDSVYHRAYF